jgi:hypothetical protein
MLGKHDLSNYNEDGAKNFSVHSIVLHPEWQWNAKLNSSFHADISIVVLNEKVEFNSYIQPVCLPPQSSADLVGEGTISGWGQSNHFERHAATPNELKVSIINAFYCLTRFPKLALIASTTSSCAGYENQGKGASPTSPWTVRGIVSGSLIDQNGQCDVNAFQLYTNVAQFADWIGKVMKETKNDALEFVDFDCKIR